MLFRSGQNLTNIIIQIYQSTFFSSQHYRLLFHKILAQKRKKGQPQWLSGLPPPSAQGVILRTRDRVPPLAAYMEPASPSACVSALLSLSLSVSHE